MKSWNIILSLGAKGENLSHYIKEHTTMKVSFFLLAGLLSVISLDYARAGSITVFTGETLNVNGVSTETSPPTGNATTFAGFITIGSIVPSTTDWTLTAFQINVQGIPPLVWTFSGILFDAASDTIFGTATAAYTDATTGSRLITANFFDGNSPTDTYSNVGITNHAGDSAGTFSYIVSTPEPSSGLLLLFGLGLVALTAAGRRVLGS
jgi:hypothetical protein